MSDYAVRPDMPLGATRISGLPSRGPAGSTAAAPEPSGEEKRRHLRVPLALRARLLLPSGEEGTAQVQNISPGGALLRCPHPVEAGGDIVLYLDGIGRVAGRVVRITKGGFAVQFTTTQAKRDRLAEKLTWELNKGDLGLQDQRAATRHARNEPAKLVRASGEVVQCTVRDISVTGVSLDIAARPPIGEIVTIGRSRGRVVRHHEHGIGVEFLLTSLANPAEGLSDGPAGGR